MTWTWCALDACVFDMVDGRTGQTKQCLWRQHFIGLSLDLLDWVMIWFKTTHVTFRSGGHVMLKFLWEHAYWNRNFKKKKSDVFLRQNFSLLFFGLFLLWPLSIYIFYVTSLLSHLFVIFQCYPNVCTWNTPRPRYHCHQPPTHHFANTVVIEIFREAITWQSVCSKESHLKQRWHTHTGTRSFDPATGASKSKKSLDGGN